METNNGVRTTTTQDISKEMALSDLDNSSPLTTSSPGIMPELNIGMSLSEQDSVLPSSKHQNESQTPGTGIKLLKPHPLLYLPVPPSSSSQQDTPPQLINKPSHLSDMYPGVHDFLSKFPFKETKRSNQTPPLLVLRNNNDNDVPYKPILAPPIYNPPKPLQLMPGGHVKLYPPSFRAQAPPTYQAPPTNQVPPTYQVPPQISRSVPEEVPHLQEWVEVVLPNIPVRPFVPRLRPSHDKKRFPLLQINDQWENMKQEGFPLLWLPWEQAPPTRNKGKRKKDKRKITFQNVLPSPPPPPLTESSSSEKEITNEPLPFSDPPLSPSNKPLPSPPLSPSNKPLPSPPLSPSNKPLPSPPLSPSNKPLPSPPPSPSNKPLSFPPLSPSNKPLPSPSPSLSPSNKPLPPQQQLSLRRIGMKSLYIDDDDNNNTLPFSPPTQLDPPPTHTLTTTTTTSIAVQVDINDTTRDTHSLLGERQYTEVTEIIDEDILHNTNEEPIITLTELSPHTAATNSAISNNNVMAQFLQLERQLYQLESTAQDMRDDFITSRRMLETIDRLNNSSNSHDTTVMKPSVDMHSNVTSPGNTADNFHNDGYHSNGYHSNDSSHGDMQSNDNYTDGKPPLSSSQPTDIQKRGVSPSRGSNDKKKVELKRWMSQKFNERHVEYKNKRNELKMKERKPFQSTVVPQKTQSTPSTPRQRRVREERDYERRLRDAHNLMDDILMSSSSGPFQTKTSCASSVKSADKGKRKYRSAELSVSSERREGRKGGRGEGREERRREGGGSYKRRISSVEGLSIREQDKIADILATVDHDDSNTTVSTIDWEQIDEILS